MSSSTTSLTKLRSGATVGGASTAAGLALLFGLFLGVTLSLQFCVFTNDDANAFAPLGLQRRRSFGQQAQLEKSTTLQDAAHEWHPRVSKVVFAKRPRVEPLNMAELLSKCPEERNASFEKIVQRKLAEDKCGSPMSDEEFVCAAQCPLEEPELESSVRVMRTGNHSAQWLVESCRRRLFPVLVWVSKTGRIRFQICVKEETLVGPTLWEEAQRMLFTIQCLVNISPRKDFLFGFDTSDYATPTYDAPYDVLHYINPVPGVVRFVGTPAHNPLLFPTSSHIVATGLCNWRQKHEWWRFCYEEKSRDAIPFKEKEQVIMWRGLPTGGGWTPSHWTLMQRMALVREFADKPGFDVGFVRDPKQFANTSALLLELVNRDWRKKSKIVKHEHAKYAFLLHVDGNTASWGISHKLNSGSTLVWVESQSSYKEHFYHLLKPWEHFVPVSKDLSDLDEAKEWLFANPEEAERIAKRTLKLVEQKMRPNDLFCYVFRLFRSISEAQQAEMDPSKMDLSEEVLKTYMEEKMFRKFRDLRDWNFSVQAGESMPQ